MAPTAYTLALADIWGYLLVAARLFGLMVFFPGLSSNTVSHKMRLLLVACLAVAFTPLIFTEPPLPPRAPWQISFTAMHQVVIGLISSLLLKTLFSALDVAGNVIGLQMSLSNIFVHNAETNQQGGFLPGFFNLMIISMIFISNLHYAIFSSFIKMFHFFSPFTAAAYSIDDFYKVFLDTFTSAFTLGVTIAGPFIIISVLTYSLAGILNRLIPQMQVFFLIQPLQLMLGFSILVFTLPIALEFFMDTFIDFIDTWGADQ